MGNLQSSTAATAGCGGAKSRNKRPSTSGAREWLMGGATRALRKPVVVPAADAAASSVGHVTVTSRDLRRQPQRPTPPSRNHDDTDHADEQQLQQRRQEHHRRDDPCTGSSAAEEDSSVFADTLTSPQSVYSDARDEPYADDDDDDDDMVVNGGETLSGCGTGRQAFTIVKHRKVELNPTKIQSAVTNGKSNFQLTNFNRFIVKRFAGVFKHCVYV